MAGTFWLMDAAARYLLALGTVDWFMLAHRSVNGYCAELTCQTAEKNFLRL
jgi:hypothetical protein